MMIPFRVYLMHMVMRALPPTRCFAFKRGLMRWCGAVIGKNVRIVSSARFQLVGRLEIGDDSWIGHDVIIVGGDADVIIGARVDIGPRANIVTGSHEILTERTRVAGRGYSLPVVIQSGSWIGAASTILGGVTVGPCSMVAAGALVNSNVPGETLVGGVPARVLKSLREEQT